MTRAVVASAPFRSRLLVIREFLLESDAGHLYEALLDDLQTTVLPNLRRFPLIGRSYPHPDEPLQSAESLAAMARLPRDAAHTLRLYVHGDYLILYAALPDVVHLLSIRHHREASFQP
jgi:hypothetical protein